MLIGCPLAHEARLLSWTGADVGMVGTLFGRVYENGYGVDAPSKVDGEYIRESSGVKVGATTTRGSRLFILYGLVASTSRWVNAVREWIAGLNSANYARHSRNGPIFERAPTTASPNAS